ncbi:hypothetical protein Pcaca05_15400 [Pectobacterium carotovorum subsp. carotovorum]|nr:hypothetical protein Pcaca05_15400 [Pectobacterium carotovorum subsp. carotovorum]
MNRSDPHILTDSKVRSAKPLAKSYKLTDSQGLYLTVSTSGAKLWYFRYRFAGKESRLAFGPYPQIILAEAREKRDAARKLLTSGLCPSLIRKTDNAAVEESRTFQYIAQAWHTSSLKLWSDAHADKILTCLKRYVFPAIGAMDIAQVETRHLAQLVKAIDDKGVHDVAGRVRQHSSESGFYQALHTCHLADTFPERRTVSLFTRRDEIHYRSSRI